MTIAGKAQQVFRFAPSPNGLLHLGHAYSALLNQDLARQAGGRMLLRVEDIDVGRATPEFEEAIYEDLAWIGIEWEKPARRQSDHFGEYQLAVDRLDAMGLIYPCYCTRKEIAAAVEGLVDWPRDPDGSPLYPGTCKRMSAAERVRRRASGAYATRRLDMEQALAMTGSLLGWREYRADSGLRDIRAEPSIWGDVVLARKDVPASYHIAVVADDATQGVTDVVRGRDLMAATSLHRLLQLLLDLPAPDYRHHRLVLDANGEKMSKSAGAEPLRALREAGETPDGIRRRLAAAGTPLPGPGAATPIGGAAARKALR